MIAIASAMFGGTSTQIVESSAPLVLHLTLLLFLALQPIVPGGTRMSGKCMLQNKCPTFPLFSGKTGHIFCNGLPERDSPSPLYSLLLAPCPYGDDETAEVSFAVRPDDDNRLGVFSAHGKR